MRVMDRRHVLKNTLFSATIYRGDTIVVARHFIIYCVKFSKLISKEQKVSLLVDQQRIIIGKLLMKILTLRYQLLRQVTYLVRVCIFYFGIKFQKTCHWAIAIDCIYRHKLINLCVCLQRRSLFEHIKQQLYNHH